MRKSAMGILVVFLALAMFAQAQTPAQAPANPKAAAPAAASYDRALLRPALLKEKAPETFAVRFETTRGDFTMNVTRAWAPIGVFIEISHLPSALIGPPARRAAAQLGRAAAVLSPRRHIHPTASKLASLRAVDSIV